MPISCCCPRRLALEGPEPDLKAAREFLERGKALHPTNIEMYQTLAIVERREKHPDRAVERLQEGIENLSKENLGRVYLLWDIAELQIQAGQFEKARKLLGEFRNAATDPQLAAYFSRFAAFLEARIDMAEGRWFKAAASLERTAPEMAVKSEEQAGGQGRSGLAKRAFLMLGLCYEHMNRPEQQYNAYRRAADIVLTENTEENVNLNVQAMLGMAQALVAQDKLDDAITQYQKLIALPGTPPDVAVTIYTNLAQVQAMRNLRLPEAKRDWSDVNATMDRAQQVSEQTNNETGLGKVEQFKTEVLLAQGREKDAAENIEAVLERHPSLVELWVAKAAIKGQKDPRDALAILTEAEQETRSEDRAARRAAAILGAVAEAGYAGRRRPQSPRRPREGGPGSAQAGRGGPQAGGRDQGK